MKPLVTVVTLTYKNFAHIYEAIDSVLAQDYPYIEYIISDDGSPNFPKKEIEDYLQKNKRENIVSTIILDNPVNVGTVKHLNNALKLMSGEYYLPLAQDDVYYNNNVISDIIDAFLTSKSEVIVTSRYIIDDENNFVGITPTQKEKREIEKWHTNKDQYSAIVSDRYYHFASGSAMYIKKEALINIGFFDEKYILWEDGPFITKYTYSHPILCRYDIISIKYRIGGISTSKEPHPLLHKDSILYQETDMIAHVDELDFVSKGIVKYLYETRNLDNRLKRALIKLKYFYIIPARAKYKNIQKRI